MAQAEYRLAPSVHWCTAHGFSVLLDMDGDRYLSIPTRHLDGLLRHLSRDDHPAGAHTSTFSPEEAQLMHDLESRGLLISTTTQEKSRQPVDLPQPDQLISIANGLLPARAALRYAPTFARACAIADYYLRFRSLREIISRVARRRQSRGPQQTDRLAYLVRAFHTLRPLYPRNYLCLFDSLALLEFLSDWHLFPNWVFGVQVDPFEAHCWIQHDSLVLCDTATFRSRWYSRILII